MNIDNNKIRTASDEVRDFIRQKTKDSSFNPTENQLFLELIDNQIHDWLMIPKRKEMKLHENEKENKEKKPSKDAKTEQINRSLGYLISIASNANSLYDAIVKAEPLLNKKLIKRLSATLHVINKIKEGKESNETPET